ncbi:MAG: FecR family protein [Elusimicrobiota bacterium]
MRAALAAGVVSALLLSCAKKEEAPLAHPKLTQLSGTVLYLDASSNWVKAASGQELPPGSQLMAKKRGWAVVSFPDGSEVRLAQEGSAVLETHGREQVELSLKKGRLQAWVKLALKRRFSVRTPTSVCSVRGTRFQAAIDRRGRTVYDLFAGVIAVSDGREGEKTLAPGQRLIVSAAGMPEPVPIPAGLTMDELPPVERAKNPLKAALPGKGVDRRQVDRLKAPEEMLEVDTIDDLEAPDALEQDKVKSADDLKTLELKDDMKEKDLLEPQQKRRRKKRR